MADFRIDNLIVRLDDGAPPKNLILGRGKLTFGSDDSSGGPGCPGCSCSCSCSCTCSATAKQFEEAELAVLKESLRRALDALAAVEQRGLDTH